MIVGPNFTFFSLFLSNFPPVYYSVLPDSFLLCPNSSWILLLGSLFFSSAPGHHCPLYFPGSFFFFFLGSSRALASPPSHVCSPDLWRVWDSTFYCPLFLGFFLGKVDRQTSPSTRWDWWFYSLKWRMARTEISSGQIIQIYDLTRHSSHILWMGCITM